MLLSNQCFLIKLNVEIFHDSVLVLRISGKLNCSEQSINLLFILQECSSPTPGPGKEWEEYQQIRVLVERIRKKQKGKRQNKFLYFILFFLIINSLAIYKHNLKRNKNVDILYSSIHINK